MRSLRRDSRKWPSDERILGSDEFVERIFGEADERMKYQLGGQERRKKKAIQVIEQTCKTEGINPKELRMGSRRGRITNVRAQIAYELVEKYGFPFAEVGRQLGVSTSAISKIISRLSKV